MYSKGEGVITDEREAYIWLSIAKVNGNESATEVLELWPELMLTTAEIKSARREATRRLEAIDQRKKINPRDNPARGSNIALNIALSEPPKSATIAEQVFEKAWRSVVVIVNNDNQGSGVIMRPNVVANQLPCG